MNSPSFGFNPIQNRYKELTGVIHLTNYDLGPV